MTSADTSAELVAKELAGLRNWVGDCGLCGR